MKLVLRLARSPRPLRDAAAWFIPGADAATWLAVLLRPGTPGHDVALLVVPTSLADPRPIGVLALGTVPLPRGGVPYGVVASRLYLPADAELAPALDDAALAPHLDPTALTYVFHPRAGLVRFDVADVVRLADLVRAPVPQAPRWNLALAPQPLPARLVGIAPDELPAADAILESGRDGIGTRARTAGELPPSPTEAAEPSVAQRAADRVATWVGRAVLSVTRLAPESATTPTWIDRLESWAAGLLGAIAERLEHLRRREIDRLLALLESDPDRGLSYALPLGDDGAHRGVAPPTGRLDRRRVDFDLARLRGGGPVDPWAIDETSRRELVRRYHALANRELELGRHRRAAYIFAHLLGDLRMAAVALVAGGHHRDAAALYRERLALPLEAAKCLERGGLWGEALALYEELARHEDAGRLLAALDRHEEARAAYERAVVARQVAGDFVGAARLLEDRLDDLERALATLEAGVGEPSQARLCLEGTFALCARRGWTDRARDLVRRMRAGEVPAGEPTGAIEVLAAVAVQAPNAAVRAEAADATLALAALRLRTAPRDVATRVLASVAALAPQDRLLGRDCGRFLRQVPVVRRPTGALAWHARAISLPQGVRWIAATANEREWFIVGKRATTLVLAYASWSARDGLPGTAEWPLDADEHEIALVADSESRRLAIALDNGRVLAEQHLPPSEGRPWPLSASTPPWIPAGVAALERTGSGALAVWDEISTALRMTAFEWSGQIGHSRLIDLAPEDQGLVWALAPRTRAGVLRAMLALPITTGRPLLALVDPRDPEGRGPLRSTAVDFVRQTTHGADVDLFVSSLDGACLARFGNRATEPLTEVRHFAEGMAEPWIHRLSRTRFVAVSRGVCRAYDQPDGWHVVERGRSEHLRPSDPIAVLSVPGRNAFAVVYPEGPIDVYDVGER